MEPGPLACRTLVSSLSYDPSGSLLGRRPAWPPRASAGWRPESLDRLPPGGPSGLTCDSEPVRVLGEDGCIYLKLWSQRGLSEEEANPEATKERLFFRWIHFTT